VDTERPPNPPGFPTELPLIEDARGCLSYAEYDQQLPFIPKRIFLIYDVPPGTSRGGHAHRRVHQFLICIQGTCIIDLDDGHSARKVRLNRPSLGLHVPPMIWNSQHYDDPGAVLLVISSEPYDAQEYIRDYAEFKRLAGAQ